MKDRDKRIGELIKEILSGILISYDFYSGPSFVITSVDVTKDLKNARVYYHADEASQEGVVEKFAVYGAKIRAELFKKLRMKFMPKVEFVFDSRMTRVMKVMDIIAKIENEEKSS